MNKIFIFLITLFPICLLAQSFKIDTSFEIKELQGQVYYDYDERIFANSETIIPLMPDEEKSKYQRFLVIDSSLNYKILKWKCLRLRFYGNIYCLDGTKRGETDYVFNAIMYHFITKLKKDRFITKKKWKCPQEINFSQILPPLDNDLNNIFLFNNHNFSTQDKVYDFYRFGKINVKKKELFVTKEIDIGKGILFHLTGYSQGIASFSENLAAFITPLKSELYLWDASSEKIDTIPFHYPLEDSRHVIDSLFPDSLLMANKFTPTRIISRMIEHRVLRHPFVSKIYAIDDDLLLIQIFPKRNYPDSTSTLYHLYSTKRKQFIFSNGFMTDFTMLNTSQKNYFIGNKTIIISDSVINDEFHYFAHVVSLSLSDSLISKQKDKHEIWKMILQNNAIPDSIIQNVAGYQHFVTADIAFCSHCNYKKIGKTLVLHVYDGYILSPSDQLINKRKYERIFDHPTVFFVRKSSIPAELKINSIY